MTITCYASRVKKQPRERTEGNRKMEKLKELKKIIENIESSYDYDTYYTELRNTTIDYMNDTQDWDFDGFFDDIVDYELAEYQAKNELEQGGLIRLYYFLGDANLNNNIFRINGYGNLTDISKDDLDYIKEQIIDLINEKLESEDQQ